MELVFHPHAVERMGVRKITVDEVRRILEKPDGKIKQSHDKWIFYKELLHRRDNLVAAVSIIRKGADTEVITVMTNFEVKK